VVAAASIDPSISYFLLCRISPDQTDKRKANVKEVTPEDIRLDIEAEMTYLMECLFDGKEDPNVEKGGFYPNLKEICYVQAKQYVRVKDYIDRVPPTLITVVNSEKVGSSWFHPLYKKFQIGECFDQDGNRLKFLMIRKIEEKEVYFISWADTLANVKKYVE
jgi:hypothetical protein